MSYFLLLGIYQCLLYYYSIHHKSDLVTGFVSKSSFYFINAIFPESKLSLLNEYTINLKNFSYITIIEGCNGISVIILFIAFIIGFSRDFRSTFFYILFGSIFLFVLNIIRIILIAIAIYHYPSMNIFLHEILFPLIMYGTVLLLWLLWIKTHRNAS